MPTPTTTATGWAAWPAICGCVAGAGTGPRRVAVETQLCEGRAGAGLGALDGVDAREPAAGGCGGGGVVVVGWVVMEVMVVVWGLLLVVVVGMGRGVEWGLGDESAASAGGAAASAAAGDGWGWVAGGVVYGMVVRGGRWEVEEGWVWGCAVVWWWERCRYLAIIAGCGSE